MRKERHHSISVMIEVIIRAHRHCNLFFFVVFFYLPVSCSWRCVKLHWERLKNWSEVPCVCPIKPTLNLKKHFIWVKAPVVHVLSDLGFSCVSFAKLMKTLFAQDWKGPPEFICRLHWCFPCPLEELNEEVVRAVHPQPAAGTSPPPVVSQGRDRGTNCYCVLVTGDTEASGASGPDGKLKA